MYAHESAPTRITAPIPPALADDDRQAWHLPAPRRDSGAADLCARSMPFFRGALAHLILAASQVQRVGGVQHIALRRHESRSPRVLLTAQLDGRELEFVTRVDIDGQARVTFADCSGRQRVLAIRQQELGSFDSPGALGLHRRAVAEFLLALRPTLLLDAAVPPLAGRSKKMGGASGRT